jgi:hypothetical protein
VPPRPARDGFRKDLGGHADPGASGFDPRRSHVVDRAFLEDTDRRT